MEVTVSSRHVEVSDGVREMAIQKIGRLERFLSGYVPPDGVPDELLGPLNAKAEAIRAGTNHPFNLNFFAHPAPRENAELDAATQSAQIGVATADLFPAFSIDGSPQESSSLTTPWRANSSSRARASNRWPSRVG